MKVKKHYDIHLGAFYSWMMGDFETKKNEFKEFCEQAGLISTSADIAIDLGAGNGIQSVALAELGFKVTSIDFNKQLLEELEKNKKELAVEAIEDDITNILYYKDKNPGLIVCCGDTIPQLKSKKKIGKFISDIFDCLSKKGKLVLSFRDYSFELKDTQRFIPVKNEEERILTCFLEYSKKKVRVTDMLHEKKRNGWQLKISSYQKVRVSKEMISKLLIESNFEILVEKSINSMIHIVAAKKS